MFQLIFFLIFYFLLKLNQRCCQHVFWLQFLFDIELIVSLKSIKANLFLIIIKLSFKFVELIVIAIAQAIHFL